MLADASPSTTHHRMSHDTTLRELPAPIGASASSSKSRTVIEATALLVFIVVAACLI